MTDIYDDAIQDTLEYDRIRISWVAGGNEGGIPLHALLFRSCPHLSVCLTECKSILSGDEAGKFSSEVQELIENLKNDDLIPINHWDLESRWNEADTESRTEMLEQFAMYNRQLDELFDREPAILEED